MEFVTYDSAPNFDVGATARKETISTRRSKDEARHSPYFQYEDFKDYRRRCMNPELLLPKDHHFYKMAVKEY